MDRQTLRDWVHRYVAEGLAGLSNRPLPGRQPLLRAEQMRELGAIGEAGPDPATDGVMRWRQMRGGRAPLRSAFRRADEG